MTLYLDSSVIVKLYIDEPGSDEVTTRVHAATRLVTSTIAFAEVRATFARRKREGLLSAQEFSTVCRRFDADWTSFFAMDADEVVVRTAGALSESHALRGGDAIHLASFERLLAGADDDELEFVCADDRLSDAARNLG
ncbi:MAG: type II toxin-antitoxin system VapC family toxin [Acidobacteria bacterium]|nr:type II toxin-antitoxin system VapC family toxin [Acidobacteriota bacterium]